MKLKVTPSVYEKGGEDGDFDWMIIQPKYIDTFFIFNDNETQFREHQDGKPGGCDAGGGNAGIRPYQCITPPKAGGIPTGDNGVGYPALTPEIKGVIDEAVAKIKSVLDANQYTQVIYSSDGKGGLGTNIFTPSADVTQYIIDEIKSLSD